MLPSCISQALAELTMDDSLTFVVGLADCGSLIVRDTASGGTSVVQPASGGTSVARLCSRSLCSAIDFYLDRLDVTSDAGSTMKLLRRMPSLQQLHTDRYAAKL